MQLLNTIKFLFKYATLGLTVGFLILFFMPNSKIPFNWQSAQEAWSFYKQQVNIQKSGPPEPQFEVTDISFSSAVKKASPSVVVIHALRQGVRSSDPLSPNERLFGIGVGSGVIISDEGYIVTNYHVVANSEQFIINFADSRKSTAELVGYDINTDLAVLKSNLKGLKAAELASIDSVNTGDLVMAIGSPFGRDQAVSIGIMSAITFDKFEPRFQTDAAINSGNSGGALINTHGDVIGINHSKTNIGRSLAQTGVNFAIPIDTAQRIVENIIKYGRMRRNWLGIDAVELLQSTHKTHFPNIEFGTGFFARDVDTNSPAAEAGIHKGDYIVELDGQSLSGIESFYRVFSQFPIGKETEVTYIRKSQKITTILRLREKIDD